MVMQLVEEAGSRNVTRSAPHGVPDCSSLFFFFFRRSPHVGVLQFLIGVAFLFACFGQIPDVCRGSMLVLRAHQHSVSQVTTTEKQKPEWACPPRDSRPVLSSLVETSMPAELSRRFTA